MTLREQPTQYQCERHRTEHKNLPGGCSAVVPPDPMPNSEVKRRSAESPELTLRAFFLSVV
ncbi:hypothetical protein BZY50_10680 [Enterobacter hormaechei]|nr:hypothetical protein BZY50_10680 [Enterobacter hormaechei]